LGVKVTELIQKRGRGRPGTYANAADRAKAWRQRQRDLIAIAQQPVEPVIIEKVVEKPVRTPSSAKANRIISKAPDASNLFPALRERFTGYNGEENAKRFRVNAARAATTARDVLALVSQREVPETETEFLRQAAQFFDHLNSLFINAQAGAKRAKIKAEKESRAKHDEKIKTMVQALFGLNPDPSQVLATANALIEFEKVAGDRLVKRYRVTRGYILINRSYELKSAIRAGDWKLVAKELAEIRVDIGEKGSRFTNHDDPCYSAGWGDFEEYRANVNI
jgi:hypothetical protein